MQQNVSQPHRRHVPQMDGLRGLACLIVLFGHAVIASLPQTAEALRGVPKIGVWIFFVLSAFLLTVRLGQSRLGIATAFDYVVARIMRIAPPFVLAVLTYFSLGQLGIVTWSDVVAVLTFQAGVGHLWTIPVETTFYVALPVVMAALSTMRSTVARIGVLAALAVAAGSVMVPMATPYNSTHLGWYLGTFLAGTAAGQVALSWRGGPMPGWVPVAAVASIVGLAVGTKLLSADAAHVLINMHWAFAVPVAILVLSLYLGGGTLSRILSTHVLTSVGHASYSIYLFHMVFVNLFRGLPDGMGVPVSLAASLATGYVGYQVVERPLARLRFAMTGTAAARKGAGRSQGQVMTGRMSEAG